MSSGMLCSSKTQTTIRSVLNWKLSSSSREYSCLIRLLAADVNFLSLVDLLLIINFAVVLLLNRLNSLVRVPHQCFSPQSSHISIICILFSLQLPKVFSQSVLVYSSNHLVANSISNNSIYFTYLGRGML